MTETGTHRSSLVLPLVAGLILATLAAYVGWTLGSAQAADAGATSTSEPPAILTEFRMPSIDGRELGPPDFKGQVVVVDFWATWCSPCRVQAKILEPLWEEMRPQGVQFLAVSLGESRDTVEKYLEEHPYPYPVLYDTEDKIATEGEIYALPTVMVIDPAGEVVYIRRELADSAAIRQAVANARL